MSPIKFCTVALSTTQYQRRIENTWMIQNGSFYSNPQVKLDIVWKKILWHFISYSILKDFILYVYISMDHYIVYSWKKIHKRVFKPEEVSLSSFSLSILDFQFSCLFFSCCFLGRSLSSEQREGSSSVNPLT